LSAAHALVVDRLSDGVIVLDVHNCILGLNPAAQNLIGYRAAEAVGHSVQELWPDWRDTIDPLCDMPDAHHRVLLKWGREQRIYNLCLSTIEDEQGLSVGRVLILSDVTERVLEEQAGRRLELEAIGQEVAHAAGPTQTEAELMRQISDLKQTQAELLRRNRELLSLQAATIATTSSLDLHFVLDTVTWEMASLLGVEGCAIFEWDREADTITMIAEYGSAGWRKGEGAVEVMALAHHPLIKRVLVERCAHQITVGQPQMEPAEAA